jgi:hypothetical protein
MPPAEIRRRRIGAPAAAERWEPAVRDRLRLECRRERGLAVVREPARAREAPHVDDEFNVVRLEKPDELLEG